VRVRLVRPLTIALRQLDTTRTKAAGAYDSEFGMIKTTKDARGNRVSERVEGPEIRIPGQVEDQTWYGLRMFAMGNSPESKLAIVFSYRTLEECGFVDETTKQPLLNVNDRLVAIYSPEGELVLMVRPPGLYAVEVRPAVLSLSGKPGIVIMRFNDRALTEAPA
jgi:hypothetical protein